MLALASCKGFENSTIPGRPLPLTSCLFSVRMNLSALALSLGLPIRLMRHAADVVVASRTVFGAGTLHAASTVMDDAVQPAGVVRSVGPHP